MREKLKYFIINKSYDYNRGSYENMRIQGSSLCFHSEKSTGVGRFMTRIFDSGDTGMTWHRLIINTENCSPENLRITVYASDKNELHYKNDDFSLYELFEDTGFSFHEKTDAFAPFIVKQVSGVSDIFLHDVSGRFLWVLIEQYSSGGSPAQIDNITIFLPAESWIDYMPQIYRRSDNDTHFLERFLGIFQTFYEELDTEIAEMTRRFDPESTEYSFLDWLAGWVGIKDTSFWTEEQLRILLLNAVDLYRKRGTKESLSEMIELYTGEKPFIVEGFEINEAARTIPNGKALLEMYGTNPYTITVLVKPGHDLEVIRRIAMEMLPLTCELNLVELDPYISLDNFAYLGVNSSLGSLKPAVLDGNSQIMLSTLGVKPEDE